MSPQQKGVSRTKYPTAPIRKVVLVLGDQLDIESPLLRSFDPQRDIVFMAEVVEEATHVWCHKSRLVFFFSAMRHFALELENRGIPVWYHRLTTNRAVDRVQSLGEVVTFVAQEFQPQAVELLEPGDHRVAQQIKLAAKEAGVLLQYVDDPHYYLSQSDFKQWSGNRDNFVLEHFYRWMRKRFDILLQDDGTPVGGSWNFDSDNRHSFGKQGPQGIFATPDFAIDAITQEVIAMIEERFATHPGSTDQFDLPVTRADALVALKHFISHRLPKFGDFQDAMWQGAEELNHSRLSPVLNVHLLNPREVVRAALDAYDNGEAALNNVEGFVRQILGWREFVRGIYWQFSPRYESLNFFNTRFNLPQFFWDGRTDMVCVADAMRLVNEKAYAHHIQRLMVLGLLAQLIGVDPYQFHQWHMAMYVDAIDWVSLPNTLGMSQYGDGGIVGTKPYCASGAYIDRMSNYCKTCRYEPKEAVGPQACPFTTLYWDFLARNLPKLQDNMRLKFQLATLAKKDEKLLQEISLKANQIRQVWNIAIATDKLASPES